MKTLEEKVTARLKKRGFDVETLLNNRGLIGATIEDTIVEFVKAFKPQNNTDEKDILLSFANWLYGNLDKVTPGIVVNNYLEEKAKSK